MSRQSLISRASQTLILWVMVMALYPPSPSAVAPALHRALQAPCQQRGPKGGSFYINKIILWNSRILRLEGTLQTISSNPLILKMLPLRPREEESYPPSVGQCGLVNKAGSSESIATQCRRSGFTWLSALCMRCATNEASSGHRRTGILL